MPWSLLPRTAWTGGALGEGGQHGRIDDVAGVEHHVRRVRQRPHLRRHPVEDASVRCVSESTRTFDLPSVRGHDRVRHARAEALDELEPMLTDLRDLPGSPSAAVASSTAGSRAFLHFHEDPAGHHVDVRLDR